MLVLLFSIFFISTHTAASMNQLTIPLKIKNDPIIKFENRDCDDCLNACGQIDSNESEALYYTPSEHEINKELSKIDDFKDLLKITHLDAKISNKMFTKRELTKQVYLAVDQWSDYHRNAMLKMFNDQIVDSVVNNILTITPKKM